MHSTINRRNKMVSFRLSDEEYKSSLEACSRAGIRSISELARAGLQQLFSMRNGGGLNEKVDDIRNRLQFLSLEVERISEEVRLAAAPAAPNGFAIRDTPGADGARAPITYGSGATIPRSSDFQE